MRRKQLGRLSRPYTRPQLVPGGCPDSAPRAPFLCGECFRTGILHRLFPFVNSRPTILTLPGSYSRQTCGTSPHALPTTQREFGLSIFHIRTMSQRPTLCRQLATQMLSLWKRRFVATSGGYGIVPLAQTRPTSSQHAVITTLGCGSSARRALSDSTMVTTGGQFAWRSMTLRLGRH